MCKLCDRIDSVIEVAEAICTLEDWKAILLEMYGDDADGAEMTDIILTDDRNVWMNMICIIAAHWLAKRRIPVFPSLGCFSAHMAHTFTTYDAHRKASEKGPDTSES
jgi:hypothetical protein